MAALAVHHDLALPPVQVVEAQPCDLAGSQAMRASRVRIARSRSPFVLVTSHEPSSAVTCSVGSPLGNPVGRWATFGTATDRSAPIAPSRNQNRSRARNADARRCTVLGANDRVNSDRNVMTSRAVTFEESMVPLGATRATNGSTDAT